MLLPENFKYFEVFMHFSTVSQSSDSDLTIVAIREDGSFSPALEQFDRNSSGYFRQQQEKGNLPKKGGRLFYDVAGQRRLMLVAVDGTDKGLINAALGALTLARDNGWAHIACHLASDAAQVKAIAQALGAADYIFEDFKSEKRAAFACHWQFVGVSAAAELRQAEAYIAGSKLCRDLVNMPANVCNPAYLGQRAAALAEAHEHLTAQVLGPAQMAELNMNAALAVAQGSANEPRLIVMEYKAANAKNSQPIVLLGKGVTFDTGGISIKPAAAMDEMKGDMGGAAAVFGAMEGLCREQLPLHVIGLVVAVENMPDGQATRPGDIVKTMSGKTVEILNTDAEGRLILCDGLTYAERFKPQAVIDMATLTGAVVIALGSHRAGLMGNSEELQEALFQAGQRSEDYLWRLPLDKEYKDMMKSPFADIANISGSREAGSITAGAFLSFFAENYAWAHLDIAGVAFRSGANKGATGRPVALLLEYLRSL